MRHTLLLAILMLPQLCSAQHMQRIKGKIMDKESRAALIGVTIGLVDMPTPRGAATDIDGNYVIDSVPVGKHTIQVSYIGYRNVTLYDVLVTSAKEVMLNVEMEEAAVKMDEVVVTRKREHINDMALVSTRTFDVRETERYAGSRSDPARMASNFAGAQGGDDSRNDIVVRGNSPQGILWRLEGVDIPSPNHFSVPGTTGGPVSMLNSKTLSNSDFFMGAFPAEYGGAIAGVFDVKLRNGNNDRYEYTAQLGVLGTEVTAEGPISRKKGASFLINYRYSTLEMVQKIGLKIGTSSVPKYQDATFKLNYPMGKNGELSFFGIGGLSTIDLIVSNLTTPEQQLYGESDRDQYFKSNTGIVGGSYKHTINKTAYTQLTIAQTGNEVWAQHSKVFRRNDFSLDSLKNVLGYDFITMSTVAHWFVNKKVAQNQTLKFGLVNNFYYVDYADSSRQYPTSRPDWQRRLNYQGCTDLIQAYAQYKYRPTEKLTFNLGAHGQYLTHNGSKSLEPRAGLRWAVDDHNIITAGYGLHSQMQQLYQYFALDTLNGRMQNYNMDFTRSHHMVAGYDHIFGHDIRARVEAYYQYLFNVPIEVRPGSSFSGLNQGSNYARTFPDSLINAGTGYNYGLELTLEKNFSHGYYMLFTASLFDSKAAGNDGVYRSTDYNTQFAFNILGGYERNIGKASTVFGGLKATYIGGKLYSPVDVLASNKLGDMVVIDSLRNTLKFRDYFRTDVKVGVRINAKRRLTHEIALDLVNITNAKNLLSLTYSSDLASQGKAYPFYETYQLGFLPIVYYRVDF